MLPSAIDYHSIQIPPCTTTNSSQDLCDLLFQTMKAITDDPFQQYEEISATPLHATIADGLRGIKPLVWIQETMADHVFNDPDSTQFSVPESSGGRPSFISLPENYSRFSVGEQKSFADQIVDCFNASGAGKPIKRE